MSASAREPHVCLRVVRQRLAVFAASPFRGALGIGVEGVLVLAIQRGAVLVPFVDDAATAFHGVGVLIGEAARRT